MKDDYVHIFQHLAHPMKCHVDCMCEVCTSYLLYPYREGISIGFNEWKRLLELIPTIHKEYPELAKQKDNWRTRGKHDFNCIVNMVLGPTALSLRVFMLLWLQHQSVLFIG